jgi:septal ring factor EnvC (AmiA/AmiB activator)
MIYKISSKPVIGLALYGGSSACSEVTMTGSLQSEFDRGKDAGAIDQRLRGVEEHLVKNNGSIAEQVTQTAQVIKNIQTLTEAIQHLSERRVESDLSFSRMSIVVLVLGTLVVIAFSVGFTLIIVG